MGLRETLEAATPGPWTPRIETYNDPGKDWHGEEYTRGISLGDDDFIETDGGAYGPTPANARLIALAPELAALVLDMAEELRRSLPQDESMDHGRDPDRRALLARLDRLGKEQMT